MGKYKVVLLDSNFLDTKIEEEVLKEISADLFLCPSFDEDTAIQYVSDADAIVVQYAQANEKILEAAKRCKVVVRLGVGVDTIDIPAATRRGIYVANVPDVYFDEVSDHTLALVLVLQRKINILSQKVKKGDWDWGLGEAKPIFALRGQTLGLVAFGNIARAVAKKAQVFGFNIIATDPFVSSEEVKKFGVESVDFNKLLRTSDVISIHAPLSKSTYRMFNEETIGKMKNTAYLINTARGGLVDNKALYNALKCGKIAGAGLDVLEEEPPKADEPLLTLDNVIITPHSSYYSEVSVIELRKKAFGEVVRVLKGRQPKYWVNRKEMSK